MSSEPRMLTIRETAAVLRLSPNKVYRMAATGELPTIKFGRAIRVDRAALDAWLRAAA